MDTTPPDIAVSAPASGAQVSDPTVAIEGSVSYARGVSSLTLNGEPVAQVGGTFAVPVELDPGANAFEVAASDPLGNQTVTAVSIVRAAPPELALTTPADGIFTNNARIAVSGVAVGAETLTVNGEAVVLAAGSFSVELSLVEGSNAIEVAATNGFGTTTRVREVVLDTVPPVLLVETPSPGEAVRSELFAVGGTATDASPLTLVLNGQEGTVLADGGFSLPLSASPALDALDLVAEDAAGNQTTEIVPIDFDGTPEIDIEAPTDGAILDSSPVTVRGRVRGPDLVVTANGALAQVAGSSFSTQVSLDEASAVISRGDDPSGFSRP